MPPKKQRADTTLAKPFPFTDLPPNARQGIAESLLHLSKLDTITQVCKNIACLSCVNKELRDFGRSLWPKLEEMLEQGNPEAWWRGVDDSLRHEKRFYAHKYTAWDMHVPSQWEVEFLTEEGDYADIELVPRRAVAEMIRLSHIYLAEGKAMKEYSLTAGDLKNVPKQTVQTELGPMYLRQAVAVTTLAQKKHGSAGTLSQALGVLAEREQQRQKNRDENKALLSQWIEENTAFTALNEEATALHSYLNAKRKKAVRKQAVVTWVQEVHGGDPTAACKCEAVQTSECKKALMGMIRGMWKARAKNDEAEDAEAA